MRKICIVATTIGLVSVLAGCSSSGPDSKQKPVDNGTTVNVETAPVTDALILTLKDSVTQEMIVARATSAGGTLIYWMPQIGSAVVRNVAREEAETWSEVTDVWVDPIFSVDKLTGADIGSLPPPSKEQYNIYMWNMRKIRADVAITQGNTGKGTTIAIVDTGIYYPHPDLAPNYAGGTNLFAPFCNTDPNKLPTACDPNNPIDDNGHGTHMAGIAAASLNGIGVYGVAPEAHLLAVRVCSRAGHCPDSTIAAGILWAADHGANVVNLSINGFVDPANAEEKDGLQLISKAVKYALNKGALVATCAQNEGLNLDEQEPTKLLIGDPNDAIVVSATGPNDERAFQINFVYSNYGHQVDLAAPGGNQVRIPKPPFFDLNQLITSTWSPLALTRPGLYNASLGTSQATAHVSGTAAVVMGKYGPQNPHNVRTRIQDSAIDIGDPGTDVYFGHGRIDVVNALAPRD